MTKLNAMRTGFVICLAMAISTLPVRAELIVDRSNVKAVKQDAKFPDDHPFDVPVGGKIELTQTPGGKQYVLLGRYRGTVAGYKSKCVGESCARSTKPGVTKGPNEPQ